MPNKGKKNNDAFGVSIQEYAEFYNIVAHANYITDTFKTNGLKDVQILESGYFDHPEYAVTWQLSLPSLDAPLQLEMISTDTEEDEENLSFHLEGGDNELTDFQIRWVLFYLMGLVTSVETQSKDAIIRNMLLNISIYDDELEWEV